MRAPLSKKVRFNIFKRDAFTCQYCGATPPSAILEVDHIDPVSNGGRNMADNLITACFDCNRGKGSSLLTAIPESMSDRAAVIQEKLEQARAYEKLLRAKRKAEEKAIDLVEEAFNATFQNLSFKPAFRQSVRVFLQELDTYRVVDYMHKACMKRGGHSSEAIKYFCGICWNVIKGEKNGSR